MALASIQIFAFVILDGKVIFVTLDCVQTALMEFALGQRTATVFTAIKGFLVTSQSVSHLVYTAKQLNRMSASAIRAGSRAFAMFQSAHQTVDQTDTAYYQINASVIKAGIQAMRFYLVTDLTCTFLTQIASKAQTIIVSSAITSTFSTQLPLNARSATNTTTKCVSSVLKYNAWNVNGPTMWTLSPRLVYLRAFLNS